MSDKIAVTKMKRAYPETNDFVVGETVCADLHTTKGTVIEVNGDRVVVKFTLELHHDWMKFYRIVPE